MGKRSKPPPASALGPDIEQRMASAIAPAELTQADRDALHMRILKRVQDDAPSGTKTIRAADMKWINAGPGVDVMVLRSDPDRRDQTVLIRMQPGSEVVGHRHTQQEECWIVQGEVFIGDHRLGQGDMHIAAPGVIHAPIRAPRGALLMIRSEMPPRDFRIA